MSVLIESDGAHRAGLVAHMMFGGVRILEAASPGGALPFVNQFFRRTKRDAMLGGEFFSARWRRA